MTRYNWIAIFLTIVGFIIIDYHTSWWVAFGVMVIVIGNNVSRSSRALELNRLKRKGLRNIRKNG